MNRQFPIDVPHDHIVEFCKKWQIVEFAVFGSVLRDDFRAESDIDVLVKFAENAKVSLFDHVDMEEELKMIFGRNVDLVSKRGIEQSRNYIRRREILGSAEVIYAAA
jgi:uncharacterized protein